MKAHFHQKKAVLTEQTNLLQKDSKRQMKALIQSLIQRREQHQARISQLVGTIYHSGDAPKEMHKVQSGSEFSELLQQLDNNEAIGIEVHQPVHESVRAFGSHVNLLATVSLKTQYFLADKQPTRQNGSLIPTLRQFFGQVKTTPSCFDCKTIPQPFKQTMDYLRDLQLQEDLFTQTTSEEHLVQYMGTRFNLGKYEQIQLSLSPLKEQQSSLVLQSKDAQEPQLGLGWLLLQRLLSQTRSKCLPQILHTLFSYPIRTFNVRDSLELIEFNEVLRQLGRAEEERAREEESESHIKIFGVDEKTGYSYEIDHLSKSPHFKYYSPILHRFKKLTVVNQEELPVKHIPLSCLQNHFVVVTLSVPSKGEYFISLGSGQLGKKYRVFVLNTEGSVVYGSTINSGQFLFCRLRAQEYELYVHPEAEADPVLRDMEQSYQLVAEHQQNFSLWVQGREVYSNSHSLGLEIRLKQEYNHYTMKIAQQYLQSVSSEKELPQPQSSECEVTIKRQIISSLGLVVDTLTSRRDTALTLAYKGSHMLADNNFQQTQTTLSNQCSAVLYNPAGIQSVTFLEKGNTQAVEFLILESYV